VAESKRVLNIYFQPTPFLYRNEILSVKYIKSASVIQKAHTLSAILANHYDAIQTRSQNQLLQTIRWSIPHPKAAYLVTPYFDHNDHDDDDDYYDE